jgi:hypothetical protein
VLLTSGIYALWCLWDAYPKKWFDARARGAVLFLALGWSLGFSLAAPHLLPLLQYAQTGARMERREAGEEERPPVGLAALPQVVVPDIYGSTQRGSLPMFPKGQGNLLESSAAAYAGVLATLLMAPLAWCSRPHRAINIFWMLLSMFALSWCLDVPGVVEFFRLPGLNMMSHNRLVFAASFATLALAAVGLEALQRGDAVRRWWFWLPAALLGALCFWCVASAWVVPGQIAASLEPLVRQGTSLIWVRDMEGVRQVQAWFRRAYAASAVLCGLGVGGWLCLLFQSRWQPWLVPVLGILLPGDLLWFAYGRSPQCDPALYYPRIPVLEEITKSAPGRVIGYNCLPTALAGTQGLHDIRGYDSVDPARLMDLMAIVADPNAQVAMLPYALTQRLVPRSEMLPPDGIHLSPVLDMLGVRYVILRGVPPQGIHPVFQGFDYWVLVNRAALPRAFVPRRVETVPDDRDRLEKLASPQFDPREVAYVESSVSLPSRCSGSATIVDEIPTRIKVSLQMETPGLVVLADLWDRGWRAYLGGQPVPILRTNHAVRGVVVPAGIGTLEFRYEPASLAWGLRLAGFTAVLLLGWLGTIFWTRRATVAGTV